VVDAAPRPRPLGGPALQPRTTAILALVAALLGAFVWFYQVQGADRRTEAEASAKRLFPELEPDDVRALEFTTQDGQEARLERGEAGWALARPLAFPADETTVSGLASGLAQLASEGTLEEAQVLDVYGLGEGAAEVRFEAGGQTHRVRFGRKTPVGYNTYVTVDEAGTVYTVPSHRASAFERPLLDLRERRVLRFDRSSVEAIELSWPGGSAALEKRDDAWSLTAPLEAPADRETVDDLLADVSFLRAEGFVDEPGAEAEQGFEEPAFQVALRLSPAEEGAAATALRMQIGRALPGGRRLARGTEASLYEIPAERLDDFPRRLGAYRYRTLGAFPPADAQTVELEFHDAQGAPLRLVAERGEAGWTSSPEPMAPGKIARLVSELSGLRAEDVEADALGQRELAALGLAPPQARFRVLGTAEEGAEAPELGAFELGAFDSSRGILARAPGAETVYRLDYQLAEHLPVSLGAFRNRFRSAEPAAEPDDEVPGLPELELPDLEPGN
jgi:hypothetical protein